MSGQSYDAIVVGGGINGLVAATYLARSRKKTLLLEAREAISELAPPQSLRPLYALDPQIVKDLRLPQLGLRYAIRDMSLIGLRADGKHISIVRDVHAAAASIAVHSQRDAENWAGFRKSLFDLARLMRSQWWELGPPLPSIDPEVDRVARTSASAWLDAVFESEALKSALCFDATEAGFSVAEPGSALTLVWRAAQEMAGLQGAVAFPLGGVTALVHVLAAAAGNAGVEAHTGERVSRLVLQGPNVAGVEVESREKYFAPLIFSSLSREHTLANLVGQFGAGLAVARTAACGTNRPIAASIVFTLGSKPAFGGVSVPGSGRFVLADKVETYVAADLSARKGSIANDLPIEFTIPTEIDPSLAASGQFILSALVRPLPSCVYDDAMKAKLLTSVVGSLALVLPDISRSILQSEISLQGDGANVFDALSPCSNPRDRLTTPIGGLFVCGPDAEPVPAISGRAARFAARLAGAVTR